MKRIGVDARPLITPHNGVGRYTMSLLEQFARQTIPHRFYLYSHLPFELTFPIPDSWVIRAGSRILHARDSIFTQTAFPLWAIMDRVDAFWSPRQQLPLLLPPYVRKVITVHDMVWKRMPETMAADPRLDRILSPPSLKIASHVIAVSHFTRSELTHFFPAVEHKVDVVYSAANLRSTDSSVSAPVSAPYFLFVGSCEPRKNIPRMLEAYRRYHAQSHAPLDLVIVGAYQWGDFRIGDFISTHNLEACVHLIQGVNDATLAGLYAHAHAVVMVSLYEGFGLPLVEAMQWAVPLIASQTTSVGEIASDAAILVDPYNVEAIQAAFERMTTDSELHLKLAAASKARSGGFTWERAAAQTLAIITGESA